MEAFAVKDGRYVYAGDRKGAEAFIEKGKTEVIDYTGKGQVMPSCGNGHAHYSMGFAIPAIGTVVGAQDDANTFLTEIVPAAVKKARENGATTIFGFGWDFHLFEADMPTRQQLDAICCDIPIYFADTEGHKGLVNTLALVNAGIMKADGTVLKKEVRGGEIVMGADGTPTGFLKEQAGTYVRSFLDNDNLYTIDTVKNVIVGIQDQLMDYFHDYRIFLTVSGYGKRCPGLADGSPGSCLPCALHSAVCLCRCDHRQTLRKSGSLGKSQGHCFCSAPGRNCHRSWYNGI